MKVRLATPMDADAIAVVVADVAAEGRWLATEPPVDAEEFALRVRATILAGRDILFVLDDGGDVVGQLGLHATRTTGVMSLGMAILEPFRGRGGGRALLEAAIAHTEESDLHKLEIEVWPDNTRAIAMYEAAGFEHEGVRRDHYRRRDGSLRSAVLMSRLFGGQSRSSDGT